MKSWYLLFTKPREEERARMNLERQGVTAYFPTIEVDKLRKSRRYQTVEPLFPRYLFIFIGGECQIGFASIRSTRGVANFVRFNNKLATVPEPVIALLCAREKENTTIRTLPKVGDKVRIEKGPYRGLDAVIQAEKGEDRVVLLLNFLNRETNLLVNYDDVSVRS